MNTKLSCLGLLTVSILLASGSYANAQSYTFSDLGMPGGIESRANGINNVGQVVGQDNGHITIWNSTTKTKNDLGTGGAALSINNLGQIAGWSGYGGEQRATVWNIGGTVKDLGDPCGGSGSLAYAINSTGQVAGWGSAFRLSTGTDGQYSTDAEIEAPYLPLPTPHINFPKNKS